MFSLGEGSYAAPMEHRAEEATESPHSPRIVVSREALPLVVVLLSLPFFKFILNGRLRGVGLECPSAVLLFWGRAIAALPSCRDAQPHRHRQGGGAGQGGYPRKPFSTKQKLEGKRIVQL